MRRSLLAPLAALAALAACAHGPTTIERTVGGERRIGAFVPPFAYEHFLRGELASAAGDDTAARDEYELARAGGADDPLLCARLAETLERLGDHGGADRALRDGLALDASSEAVHLARATVLEARGDADGALAAYEAAHEGAPESARPILGIVRLSEAGGARARAIELLRELAATGDIGRGAVLARATSTDDPVELETLAHALAADEPRVLAVLARRALELGHAALAHRLLGSLSSRPEDRALRIEVALAAHDAAELRSILLTPPVRDDPEALAADARAYLAVGDPVESEARARAALALGPSPAASLALGLALEARGALAEAAEILAAIPEGTSATQEARAALARVLAAAGLPAVGDEIDGD